MRRETGVRNNIVQERRQRPRNPINLEAPAFIEIKHTYGPIRKSVYRVAEYNDFGTSFLVPAADGYFRAGYPLEYALVKPDLSKTERFGIVRYYHPYNDEKGESFFKVGVENKTSKSFNKPLKFHIRPERYNLAGAKSEQAIYFAHGDQEYQFPLVDISRYSAAFFCGEDQALGLSTSAALEAVEIVYGMKTIFEGTVIITRREPLPGDGERYRIVIEPRNAIFNVDIIETQESLTSVARAVESLIITTQKHRRIDQRFKSLIADMRFFLEGYRRILDAPVATKLSLASDEKFFLDELSQSFSPETDRYLVALNEIIYSLNLNEADHGLYKSYFQSNFHQLLMAAPFCHRTYFKPLGYPGDFEMMRMIEQYEYQGPSLFYKLMNKAILDTPPCVANRNRIEILADRIARFVEQSSEETVRLLSIASGPALEIQKLLKEKPRIADRIHLTLLDQEAEALRYSQDSIYMKRILHGCNIQVDLIHERIGAFFKALAREKNNNPCYDLIYIFGLFDYFDDRTCLFCINNSSKLIKDGGKLVISNYSLDGHNHRAFTEYALEWYMIYRNREQMEKLGRMAKRPAAVHVDEDPTGIIKFLELDFGVSN